MNVKRTVLPNGLRVIAVPMKESPTVTVLVLVEAGSHYEKKDQNGISHFLEHMCFKGTTNRPSPMAISTELDGLGATSNAFTSYEYTGYYAKARSKNFPKLLDVIADMYLHPTVPAEELEKEKGVIIEEMHMYEDLPMRSVGDLLDATMYGDQPAGRKIVGTEKIIRRMERSAFLQYRNKHYIPKATAVIVAGAVDPQRVLTKVRAYFSETSQAAKPRKPRVREAQKSPQAGVEYKKSSQAHFQLGFRSVPIHHKDVCTIEVLKTVLGQGMSSRLFKKLREEMGVAYYVRAESENHSDHGKFVIASGVDVARIKLVLDVIVKELKEIKKNLIPQKEFTKAKEYLLGNTLMSLESSDELASYFGGQEILHRPLLTPEQYLEKIKKVTPVQVRRVAQKIFKNNKANLAIVGPFKTSLSFKKLVRL